MRGSHDRKRTKGRNRAQVFDPMLHTRILDADTHPDIRRPCNLPGQLSQAGAALGENLKRMLRAILHRSKHPPDELQRHMFVKEVAHRVDEDQSRLAPALRQLDGVRMQCDLEALPIPGIAHGLQAQRQALRVTALTVTGAHLRASRHGIPGRFCPLDVRALSHRYGLKMFCAILSAVGEPLGFPAAKHSRYNGTFREFRSGSGLSATAVNTVFSRSTKSRPIVAKSAPFVLISSSPNSVRSTRRG